jgi:hypothetical protein
MSDSEASYATLFPEIFGQPYRHQAGIGLVECHHLQRVPTPSLLTSTTGATCGQKKYQQRSPAMALGLAAHIFTVKAILLTPVYLLRV